MIGVSFVPVFFKKTVHSTTGKSEHSRMVLRQHYGMIIHTGRLGAHEVFSECRICLIAERYSVKMSKNEGLGTRQPVPSPQLPEPQEKTIMDVTLWYAVPSVIAISLVYSATRHEKMRPILVHAGRTAVWIAGFMVAVFVVLEAINWQIGP
jgi:hypothetical protein